LQGWKGKEKAKRKRRGGNEKRTKGGRMKEKKRERDEFCAVVIFP